MKYRYVFKISYMKQHNRKFTFYYKSNVTNAIEFIKKCAITLHYEIVVYKQMYIPIY